MRRPSFAREIVTVLRKGPANRHGERTDIGTFDVAHCSLSPGGSSELTDGQQRTITTFTLIGPRLLDGVRAYDSIEHRGIRYQVEGEPQSWPQHTELTLRRVEG